nr:hypothetical protein [Tanacetum cinerariifolium]
MSDKKIKQPLAPEKSTEAIPQPKQFPHSETHRSGSSSEQHTRQTTSLITHGFLIDKEYQELLELQDVKVLRQTLEEEERAEKEWEEKMKKNKLNMRSGLREIKSTQYIAKMMKVGDESGNKIDMYVEHFGYDIMELVKLEVNEDPHAYTFLEHNSIHQSCESGVIAAATVGIPGSICRLPRKSP